MNTDQNILRRSLWAIRWPAVLLTLITARVLVFSAALAAGETAAPATGRDYSAIDRHATNTPAEAEISLEALAAYLSRPARDDLEKARAIFAWMAARLTYDLAAYKSEKRRNQTAEELLASRRGVCGCYVNLFHRLAQLSGLQSAPVTGYSKGFGYTPGADIRQSKHSWVALRHAGAWLLIDPTWGSGYLDEKNRFHRRLDEQYFCTPPRQLILTHFPDDPEFQLLDPPVTFPEFEEFVYLYPAFLRMGLRVGSHPKGLIPTGADLRVTLQGSNTLFLMALLSRNGKELPRNLAFVQNAAGTFEILAVFPEAGEYTLRVFARQPVTGRPAPAGDDFVSVMEYTVKASAGKGPVDRIGFPDYFRDFTCGRARLHEPFTGSLKAGSSPLFKISVPGAVKVALIMDGDKQFVNLKRGQAFEGRVKVSEGPIKLGAMFPGDKGYRTLLIYNGR